MTALDCKNEKYAKAATNLVEAAKGDNEQDFAQAFADFAGNIEKAVLEEHKASLRDVQEGQDVTVLAARGVRQLTSEEKNYYQKVIGAMQSKQPAQALTELDVVMPKTIVENVFEDLTTLHPLLNAIDFQSAGAVTEWLINSSTDQLATWSPLCAEIVKELTSGFKKIDLLQNKLSAFLPVCKAMLELGPQWLDRYVRDVLFSALFFGLEDGILNGRGQTNDLHEPIGMRKNLRGSVVAATGYPDKVKLVLNSLDPASYGALLSTLVKTENGHTRVIDNVIMVVNPKDYLTKVMPATTVRTTDGSYNSDVLPFPTTIIQSAQMPENEAIVGLGKSYLMATGTGKSGKIEYSDEYRFLEDERMYLVKFYGHGQPKDNNSFILADITNLKPTVLQVEVKNAAEFPTA